MNTFLIFGTEKIVWARKTKGLLGSRWDSGSSSAFLHLGKEGLHFPTIESDAGETKISPFLELDRCLCSDPAKQVIKIDESANSAAAPASSSWKGASLQEAFALFCDKLTGELGQPGLILMPGAWKHAPCVQALSPFEDAGWRFARLETAVWHALGDAVRVISRQGGMLHIGEAAPEERNIVVPDSLASCAAMEGGRQLLQRLLRQSADSSAADWQAQETAGRWITEQLFEQCAVKALSSPSEGLAVFDGNLPGVFTSSNSASAEAAARLNALRATFRLSLAQAVGSLGDKPGNWWKNCLLPSFWRDNAAFGGRQVTLARGETVFVGTDAWRSLGLSVVAGKKYREMQPKELCGDIETGERLRDWAQFQEEAPPERTPPTPAPAIDAGTAMQPPPQPDAASQSGPANEDLASVPPATPLASDLASFDPRLVVLPVAHRGESVRITVDGHILNRTDFTCLSGTAESGMIYRIDAVAVPHGAIVRVDFDSTRKS